MEQPGLVWYAGREYVSPYDCCDKLVRLLQHCAANYDGTRNDIERDGSRKKKRPDDDDIAAEYFIPAKPRI